jgi:hypothetical protein
LCAKAQKTTGYGWTAWLIWVGEDVYMRRMNAYRGRVVEITDDTITLQQGTKIPRTFLLTPALVHERIPLVRRVGTGHRLKDIKLEDSVFLDVEPTRAPEGFIAYTLGITRRPGGTIPPAEDAHLPEHLRMHHYFNARQTAELRILPGLRPVFASVAKGFLR